MALYFLPGLNSHRVLFLPLLWGSSCGAKATTEAVPTGASHPASHHLTPDVTVLIISVVWPCNLFPSFSKFPPSLSNPDYHSWYLPHSLHSGSHERHLQAVSFCLPLWPLPFVPKTKRGSRLSLAQSLCCLGRASLPASESGLKNGPWEGDWISLILSPMFSTCDISEVRTCLRINGTSNMGVFLVVSQNGF